MKDKVLPLPSEKEMLKKLYKIVHHIRANHWQKFSEWEKERLNSALNLSYEVIKAGGANDL